MPAPSEPAKVETLLSSVKLESSYESPLFVADRRSFVRWCEAMNTPRYCILIGRPAFLPKLRIDFLEDRKKWLIVEQRGVYCDLLWRS